MSKSRIVDEHLDVTSFPYTSDEVTFRQVTSQLMEMTSENGVRIQWDGGFRIYITLHPSLKSRVSYW